jgi:hypothetical protein
MWLGAAVVALGLISLALGATLLRKSINGRK